MQRAWSTEWAALSCRLIDDLPLEALDPLRVAFKISGAMDVRSVFSTLNGQSRFTGANAEQNIATLIFALQKWKENESLVQLRKEAIKYFPVLAVAGAGAQSSKVEPARLTFQRHTPTRVARLNSKQFVVDVIAALNTLGVESFFYTLPPSCAAEEWPAFFRGHFGHMSHVSVGWAGQPCAGPKPSLSLARCDDGSIQLFVHPLPDRELAAPSTCMDAVSKLCECSWTCVWRPPVIVSVEQKELSAGFQISLTPAVTTATVVTAELDMRGIIEALRTSLNPSTLNLHGMSKHWLGVHGNVCVGFRYMDSVYSLAQLQAEVQLALSSLFPPLPSARVVIYTLRGTLPTDWKRCHELTVKDMKEAYEVVVRCNGRAMVSTDSGAFEVWCDADAYFLEAKESPNTLVNECPVLPESIVLELTIELPSRFPRALLAANSLCKLVDHTVVSMDNLEAWLRVRIGCELCPLALTGLTTSSFIRVCVCPSDSGMSCAQLQRGLGDLASARIEFSETVIDPQSCVPRLLKTNQLYPRFLVVPISPNSLRIARKLITSDETSSAYHLLFVVTTGYLLACRSSIREVLREFPDVTAKACDACLLSFADVAHRESKPDSILPSLRTTVSRPPWLEPVGLTAATIEELRPLAKDWLLRKTRAPPSWDLVHLGIVVRTKECRVLSERLAKSLKHVKPGEFHSFNVIKQLPASGATAMVRLAAFEQRERASVYWILPELMPKFTYDDFRRELQSQVPPDRAMLVVADDTFEQQEALQTVLCAVATEKFGRIVLLCVKSSEAAQVDNHSIPVSPFLDNEDITLMVRKLDETVGLNDGRVREALHSAADEARKRIVQNALTFERHLFVFGLAAARGEYEPAKQWVGKLMETISRNRTLLSVAFALAFVAAFSARDVQSVPETILSCFRGNFEGAEFDAFRKLFESIYSREDMIACIHPYIARLILALPPYELDWEKGYLDWGRLLKCWQDVGVTLETYLTPAQLADVLKRTLMQRPVGERFSRLVAQFVEPDPAPSETRSWASIFMKNVTEVERIFTHPPRAQHLHGGHQYVVLARVCRHFAKKEKQRKFFDHAEKFHALAIAHAENAYKELKVTEAEFLALHVLATILANASKHSPNREPAAKRADRAYLLFCELHARCRDTKEQHELCTKVKEYFPDRNQLPGTQYTTDVSRSRSEKGKKNKSRLPPDWWGRTPPADQYFLGARPHHET